MPVVDPCPDDTAAFLLALYGEEIDGEWLTLFGIDRTTGGRAITWAQTLGELAAQAHQLAPTHCVWFGVATRRTRTDGRGTSADCARFPGFWVDIDITGPGHVADDLPATLNDAFELMSDMPIPPTCVVFTGGGLQAWWLFAEPIAVDTESTAALERWGTTWSELGRRRGWHVDNVFDVARIMRLPGTVNRKNDPVEVTIIEENWTRRYGLDDLDQFTIEAPPVVSPPARALRLVPYVGVERAGDALNASGDGGEILERVGWTLDHTDRNGDRHYRAPHHRDDRGATGATVYADDGHTTIWSDTVAKATGMATRRPYDPFGLYTWLQHRGDFTASARELERQGYGTDRTDLSWLGGLLTRDDPSVVKPGSEPRGTEGPSGPSERPSSGASERREPQVTSDPASELIGQMLTTAQLRAMPPIEWIIDGVLTSRGVSVLAGHPGTYKTFCALSEALCISTGTDWNGHSVRQGLVVYMAGEGIHGLGVRVGAWMAHHGIDDPGDILFLPSTPSLIAPDSVAVLEEVMRRLRPTLVVVDTFARATTGADENSAKDMGQAIEAVDRIRRASDGGHIQLVHHLARAAGNLRGSTAIQGGIDTAILLEREDREVVIRCEKQKDGPEFEDMALGITPVLMSDLSSSVVLISSHGGVRLPDFLVSVLQLLPETGVRQAKDLISDSDLPRPTMYRRLKSLVDGGYVRQEKGGYSITQAGATTLMKLSVSPVSPQSHPSLTGPASRLTVSPPIGGETGETATTETSSSSHEFDPF